MYSEEVVERFKNPKNAGEMKDADGVGEEGNFKCGDVMKIYIKVKDDIIVDVKFLTYGCIAAIAATDALCEAVKGKTLDEALEISPKEVAEKMGGLPAIKMHCSVMGKIALKLAVEDYRKKLSS
jgi:nitrogen fixation protein NifU and related proteins